MRNPRIACRLTCGIHLSTLKRPSHLRIPAVRSFLVCLVMLVSSISSFATSYPTGEVAGFFGWSHLQIVQWTPRIPDLPWSPGIPGWNPRYFYPAQFSNASLAVTCNPSCAVGNMFSIDLTMSNFSLTGHRPDAYPDLNIFVGTLNLITKPIVLSSSSGIAIARFSLTGDLQGCADATCGTSLFTLAVNTHAYARITYSLAGGQLSITALGYALPEPSSIALFSAGLALVMAKFRGRRSKSRRASPMVG